MVFYNTGHKGKAKESQGDDTKMKIGKRKSLIVLSAETKRETELLRELFNEKYKKHSFGYSHKIRKTPRGLTDREWSLYLQEQSEKQVLSFKMVKHDG